MSQIEFEAEIRTGARGGAMVTLPFDPKEKLGSARAKVVATFDGHAYRGSVAVMNGIALIGVRSDVRAAIGKGVGDIVRVTIRVDDTPRTVTVPEDLAAALEGAGRRVVFDELSYTARREAVESVTGARRQETRLRRIDRVLAGLVDR